MTHLSLSFLLASFSLLAAAQTGLQNNLTSLGLTTYFPGDAQYAAASAAYNRRFTVTPAAIVYPNQPADVASIVKSVSGFPIVARSGGHSYIANGLGGTNNSVVIDLSKLTSVSVNKTTGVATIQTGNRLGDIALALNAAGQALPHGTCPYVGIGGHSGHGGFGFTSRMWGLTLDTVISATVVLANGTTVTASNTTNTDLFWVIRGSSSSFGIVTSIHVQTFPVPTYAKVFQYQWQLTAAAAAKALGVFQSFVQTNIPQQLGMEINLGRGNTNGSVSFELSGAWYGAQSALNSTLKLLLAQLPTPSSVTLSGNGTYIDSVTVLGGLGRLNTHSAPDSTDTFYAKSLMTSSLNASVWSSFTKYLATAGFSSNLAWFMQVELYGGSNSAINEVPVDSTAFARRNATFTFQLYASSPNRTPPYPSSGFTFVDSVANSITSQIPSNSYGAYLNYIDDKLTNWQSLYYGSHYARLQSIKKRVDPRNVFHFPESVEEPY